MLIVMKIFNSVLNFFVSKIEQVCVQPPLSAVNVTLPAFTAERWRLLHSAIHRYLLPQDAQLQTLRTPLLLSIDGTDRQTGGWKDARRHHGCEQFA